MTTSKKARKSLGDTLATSFVYGDKSEHPQTEPIVELVPEIEPTKEAENVILPKSTVLSKLMQKAPDKEPMVRLTVDLPQSIHKRLSVMCTDMEKSKVEVVRLLIEGVLQESGF